MHVFEFHFEGGPCRNVCDFSQDEISALSVFNFYFL